MKNISTIIFDLFHTLSSIKQSNTPGKETSLILGIDKEVWLMALNQKSEERLTGKIRNPFLIIKSVTDRLGLKLTDSIIREAALSREKRFRNSLHHISNQTHDTLKELKKRGYKLGLISNADAMEISGWHHSSIAPYFDTALFSCNVGCAKPDREIYDLALEKLNIRAEKSVFVGDGGSDELITARKLGMSTILTTEVIQHLWPKRIPELIPQADLHITDITELLEILPAKEGL